LPSLWVRDAQGFAARTAAYPLAPHCTQTIGPSNVEHGGERAEHQPAPVRLLGWI
jgi:hypothetical protein